MDSTMVLGFVGAGAVFLLPALLAAFSGSLAYFLVALALVILSAVSGIAGFLTGFAALFAAVVWLLALLIGIVGALGRTRRRRNRLMAEQIELQNRALRKGL